VYKQKYHCRSIAFRSFCSQRNVLESVLFPQQRFFVWVTLKHVKGWFPYQGGNKVCFFIADPIFVRKFLILDSKSVTNFRPWSHKYGTALSLIPKRTADPDPMVYDPWTQGCDLRSHPSDPWSHPFDPWSHIPRYDPAIWSLQSLWSLRSLKRSSAIVVIIWKPLLSLWQRSLR